MKQIEYYRAVCVSLSLCRPDYFLHAHDACCVTELQSVWPSILRNNAIWPLFIEFQDEHLLDWSNFGLHDYPIIFFCTWKMVYNCQYKIWFRLLRNNCLLVSQSSLYCMFKYYLTKTILRDIDQQLIFMICFTVTNLIDLQLQVHLTF